MRIRTRPTMDDVAARAGLSLKTVSRVLNQEPHVSQAARRRVLQAVEALSYRRNSIARSLVTKRTNTVGLIVPDVRDPFWPEVIRGIETRATAAGYALLLCNTDEDSKREQEFISLLLEKQVDGIILCSSRATEASLRTLTESYPNLVLVNRRLRARRVPSVRVDNVAGGYQAARHLLGHGFRRLAVVAGPSEMRSTHERLQGFSRALAEAGLALLSVANAEATASGWARRDAARRVALDLLKNYRPEAIFAHDDLAAFGVIEACRSLNLPVPENVAVIGFDDIPVASLSSPSLTTLAAPKHELGFRAMDLFLGITRSERPDDTLIRPQLVVRESCGCHRAD